MSQTVTMYSTGWCGYCVRLKRQMEEAGISYREIDVDVERQYEQRIVDKTGGYRTVPTIEVDGELLVNPTIRELKDHLGSVSR